MNLDFVMTYGFPIVGGLMALLAAAVVLVAKRQNENKHDRR